VVVVVTEALKTSSFTDQAPFLTSVVGLQFNVPFQHKYGYIRDDPNLSKRCHSTKGKHLYITIHTAVQVDKITDITC